MGRRKKKTQEDAAAMPVSLEESYAAESRRVRQFILSMAAKGLMPWPRDTEEQRRRDDARRAAQEERYGLGSLSPAFRLAAQAMLEKARHASIAEALEVGRAVLRAQSPDQEMKGRRKTSGKYRRGKHDAQDGDHPASQEVPPCR